MAYHILYLSYDGLTDPLGQSQVIPYLVGLSQKGYRFTIISFEKNTRFEQHRDSIQKLLAAHMINWYPLIYHKSPPIVSTLYDIYLLQRAAIKLHKEQNFSIVHCRSYITALVGLTLKKSFGLKFVFDMRGFWADERVEGGIWNLKNPFYKWIYHFFKRKEIAFLEQSDYTISLTEDGKKVIHEWNIKNNPILIQVIPCCADLHLFVRSNITPLKVTQLRKDLGIKNNDFILLYLGSLGTWYMLDEMLVFFKVLLEYRPDARFLFITKDNPKTIIASAGNKGIQVDKLIITPVERNLLPNYMALAHVSIFFIRPVFSKKASSPTKQGEFMGMGIPIICNAGVGDTAEIIEQTGSGAVIADFNEACYREICEQLDSLLKISPEKIRSCAEQHYSLEKGIEAYSQVYEALL